jgi:hypothetical protein
MSEENNVFLDKEQTESSPKIKGEILELLDGDLKKSALGFISYLKSKQMIPLQWFGPTYWRIPYEKNYLCGIVLNKNRWRFWFFSGDYNGEFKEEYIKAVQDNVGSCVSCTDDCPKGKDTMIFGKKFINACFQFPIQFENPNDSTLEYIKELIEYWKGVASRSDSWHCH